MPLEDMFDDDSFHERPPRQSLLPELPDDVDGGTVQSLEFGRRALSEDPRYTRRVSERFADFSELGAVDEEFEIDGTFINRRRTGAFDPLLDQTIVEEDEDTVEALTGRRDGLSSDADLGVFGQADDDTEEPTFRFHIPEQIRAPRDQDDEVNDTVALLGVSNEDLEPEEEEEGPALDEQEEAAVLDVDEPDDEATDAFGMTGWESDPGADDDVELAAYREEESALDRSLQVPEAPASVQKRMGKRRKELKLSRIGLDYPSFPAAPIKKLALSFMKSQGSKAQLDKETLAALVETTDDFFEQIGIDLAAYAQHAGRKVIEESDVLALMKRYVTFSPSVHTCTWSSYSTTILTRPGPARRTATRRVFRSRRKCCLGSYCSNYECSRSLSSRARSGNAWLVYRRKTMGEGGLQLYDQSELWRTRRCVPERGFLTTIQNMIEVAKLNAYLDGVSRCRESRVVGDVPCEDVLRVVVPQVYRRRPPNRYTLRFALIVCE